MSKLKSTGMSFVAYTYGYTAVGKSTVAKKLAAIRGTVVLHSAMVRKELDLTPADPKTADIFFNYHNRLRDEVDRVVYSTLVDRAVQMLNDKLNVVLDAGFFFRWQRNMLYRRLRDYPVELVALKVVCSDEDEIKARLKQRFQEFEKSPLNETPSWDTYLATKEVTEPIERDIPPRGIPFSVIRYDSMTNNLKILCKANDALYLKSIVEVLK